MVDVGSSDESRESIWEAHSNVSNISGSDMDPMKDDPPTVSIPRGIISIQRMHDLVSRYGISLSYMYRIPSDGKYISVPGPLKFSICDESF